MTAIIYTRISSPNQSSFQGNYVSIENQLQECTKYCNSNNIKVIKHISEVVSGKDITKQILLNSILRHKNIDVVFYNITRFCRNTMQGIDFVNKCIGLGINLHFVEEGLTGTHFMDMHRLRLGLSQSEYESNTISNRIKSSNKVLKAKGWKFGKPKFGKKVDFKNGIRKFSSDTFEQNLIDFILMAKKGICSCKSLNKQLKKLKPKSKDPIVFVDYEKDITIERFDKINTLTYQEIAELLNSYEIFNRGNEWTGSSVSSIYKNGRNALNVNLDSLKISK